MTKIIILAAGKGVRMNSGLPKVLTPLKGKPMISYLLKAVSRSGVDKKPIIVVSPQNKAIIRNKLKGFNLEFVVQKKQLGTGNAVACTKEKIGAKVKNIIVLNGDHPFIKAKTIRKLAKIHSGAVTMMVVRVKNFSGWQKNFYHWGRILKGDGYIKAIVEFKDANKKVKRIKEVNPAIYCFNSRWLWRNISKIKNNNAQKEYYLTDIIGIAFKNKILIKSVLINAKEAMGINSIKELGVAEGLIN